MKKGILLVAILATSLSFGQNTFPATGNVGIGTTSPAYNLDISTIAIPTTDTYSGLQLQSSNYGYVLKGGLKQNFGGHLSFSTNNAGTITERIRFEQLGNVGIGTVSPEAPLHIEKNGVLLKLANNSTNFAYSGIDGLGLYLE